MSSRWPACPRPVTLHHIIWWQHCGIVVTKWLGAVNFFGSALPSSGLAATFYYFNFKCPLSSHFEVDVGKPEGDQTFRPSRRSAFIEGFAKGSRTHRVDILGLPMKQRALRTCRSDLSTYCLHPSASASQERVQFSFCLQRKALLSAPRSSLSPFHIFTR